jgi:hypothetical protein
MAASTWSPELAGALYVAVFPELEIVPTLALPFVMLSTVQVTAVLVEP